MVISPQIFLPNLSRDGQENATFGAKNTNPHTAISKPVYDDTKDTLNGSFPEFMFLGTREGVTITGNRKLIGEITL